MYSTCLFCHASLGTNEAIEHFPVGRRLAFDAAKGRLWVVCRACARWNLSPLEERWEAIEECERAFRDSRLRVSTEQVGLARLREGTTLIRIGTPQRPELAAWRYGDQFGRRRRRHLVLSATVATALAGVVIAGPVMGIVSGAAAFNLFNVGNMARAYRPLARLTTGSQRVALNRHALNRVSLRANAEFGYELEVPYILPWDTQIGIWATGGRRAVEMAQPSVTLHGDDALRAARILLPRINAKGGKAAVVNDAVSILENTPHTNDLFARLADDSVDEGSVLWPFIRGDFGSFPRPPGVAIAGLPASQRLALEMSLHEADERRALEGELAELEGRWKEAEEIASISDELFLPGEILARLRALKDR